MQVQLFTADLLKAKSASISPSRAKSPSTSIMFQAEKGYAKSNQEIKLLTYVVETTPMTRGSIGEFLKVCSRDQTPEKLTQRYYFW